MSRFLNRCGCWMVWLSLAVGTQSASAFSMLGPPDRDANAVLWQNINIGYERHQYTQIPDGSVWDIHGDDFAWHPHNLGEIKNPDIMLLSNDEIGELQTAFNRMINTYKILDTLATEDNE